MTEKSSIRLNKVLRELNISLDRVVDHLSKKGIQIEARPTTKISDEIYQVLLDEFEIDKSKKDESAEISEEKRKEKEKLRLIQERLEKERIELQSKNKEILNPSKIEIEKPKTIGKIDLKSLKSDIKVKPKSNDLLDSEVSEEQKESEHVSENNSVTKNEKVELSKKDK